MQLSGYSLDRLREDGEFILYRAHAKQQELPPLLLLAPASTRPSPETLKKIEHQYSLRSELDSAWAARPLALSERDSQTDLVLEDPGGETLDGFLSGPMEMRQFLGFAVGLATALGGLHERKLIHKDIKPTNILVNSTTGQVWLMGFGIASRLRREHQAPEPPEFIEGTLPYMAPEQTGRMNRSIDSRSDLYALGITLYEMLTGDLPFTASDPIEWVHCHIARYPVPPHQRVQSIPVCVSAIVMKLLAKTPEDRYQTASGVESDLRRCLAEWQAHGSIADFSPGQHDAPDRLLIPEKLYGRAREIETLLTAFDRVVAGGRPELVLVSGYSGIGKSAVVNELHKPLVPPRGLFASGKFDQYKRDIPYATLAQAFQSLTRPLLSKSEEDLSKWRDALHEALDPNGQLMVALVPELKAIIGAQPPVPELPQQDAQRRFHLVFRRFINVFARPEHPLALFLDDLQWLDAATLDLMEDLLTQPDVKHLLLIGAYRDNEVDPTHPLVRKLQAMRQAGALLQDIVLAPLTRDDLEQLIADSLRCELGHAGPLAELVHDKTSGNPFFAIQFLSALFEEGLLTFDHVEGRWSWDLNRIHAKRYTDNVVDLMVGKLARLVPETQNALKQLACLGNSAEFTMLRVVNQDSTEQVHAQLAEAVGAGFILRSKDSYRFLHDRVQEAAYSLIPEDGRVQAHLRIGRLLAAHTSPNEREERIFEIVNQLNRGSALISSRDEKEQLAEFNLIAGKRAKASTAYVSALHYLVAGATLLAEDGWDYRPDLMFALELHRAECEFLTGELAAAAKRLAMLAARAVAPVDQSAVACLRIDLYTTLNQSDLAIDVGLSYLRHLGGEWTPHPTKEQVQQEYNRIWPLIGDREIEELIDLPLMSKPESVAAVEVMDKALPPALFTDTNLFPLLLWRIVNFSLEHGNTDASCYAYVHGGALAGSRFSNYKAGFRLGQLGYDLVELRGLKRFKARTHIGFGVYTVSWTKHWRMARELIRDGFDAANTIGDVTWAAYSWHNLIGNLIATGDPLPAVQLEAERGLAFARKIRFGFVIDNISTQLALIRTLCGSNQTFGVLNDGEFGEAQIERRLSSDPGLAFVACWYWTRKLQARFFAGDYSAAVDASWNAQRVLWTSECFIEEAEACFYGALSHAACCNVTLPLQYQQHVEALTGYHKQLVKWAESCSENFENRAALVGAEIARIEGRALEAEQLYEQAIRSARSNGFVNNEAIAYELAARFYAARGFQKFADSYLLEARYCYQRWGADGKVAQLDRLYPHLKKESLISTPTSTILAPTELLDLATVIKVSKAVSGEMVLEKLIDSLMRSAIEQAGAERGLLIVPRRDELQIEAEATTAEGDVIVHLADGGDIAPAMPESLVRYVMRTQENVIIEDASAPNPFSADPYIVHHRPRSILTLPLINRGKLISILHLENNLTPHVFTPDRITVLKVLASQAAMSLENTRLYRDLEDRERKIRRLFDANVVGIVMWNLDGAITGANEAFLRMVQYDHKDLASGRVRWTDLTPAEWRYLDESAIAELKASGVFQPVEKEYFRKDGSRVPILLGGALFENSGNEGVAFILDLSDQKRTEAEIRALKDQLYKENLALRDEVERTSMFDEIVGTSNPLKAVLSRIAKVAPTNSTVLITGETGTGKELIARAIHRKSQRAERAFVSVNCAAIPRDLIPSELFGHEKGAFTGATQRRLGRFELADGGTIFLDEVGELLHDTQVALLRVLQEREFERVGGGQPIHVDVRVIAATNRDLEAAVANGTFRQDLFYRLNVFPIEVPPLRERKDDLQLLVEYFVQRYGVKAGKDIHSIEKKTLDLLQSYDWPGNIRELQNVIERSVILSSGDVFSVDKQWLSQRSVSPARPLKASPRAKGQVEPLSEREIIEGALAATRGRVSGPSGAAEKLGIRASTLEARIKALKINKLQFKFR
jgi:PAS domain S-box-containing protein